MPERHPLGTEITQRLTAHQRIKRRRWVPHSLKYGSSTWEQLIGQIAQNSGSISQLAILPSEASTFSQHFTQGGTLHMIR